MAGNNKYDDMSALTALNYAKNNHLLLPDIQREYCWDISEIERLFESMVDDYPVGSCIFWKTNKKTINNEKPNLYYFLRDFKQGVSKNEKAPEAINEDGDYYIVLDGQQRITSMNIALYGSYAYYKGGRGHNRSNPKSWVKKELYYDLGYYEEKEEDDEKPSKRFTFLTEDESKVGNFYKVKTLLTYDTNEDFLEWMISQKFNKESRRELSTLYKRLHNSQENGLVHYYCIYEDSYDKALDIFVRVNSTGRKLTKSDLLFSTLIDDWKEGKDNIETLLATMNSKGDGFRFSRDFLMRLCLVLVDANTNLKINSLTNETIQKIRSNWALINSSLDSMSSMLANIGICNENLTSYNATMPLAYYLYKGGEIKDANAKKETRKFLSVSLAKRLFGVASNDALNSTRNALKDLDCKHTPFSLGLFSSITLTGGRTFTVTENDIDYWLDNYEKGQNTYILLSLLYPNLKLSQVAFHQDHCHPYIGFETKAIKDLKLSDDVIKDWQRKRNLLPNLQFLEGCENESKNKTPLKEWVKAGNDFKYHPDGVSLELKDFETFFVQRRKLIKIELMKIFELPIPSKKENEPQCTA
ncbi:MAG: DUF262 domain-containing protein [Solobacterium sp.]|nr:DUF262 domain-containing protein [Solobacterium sp.]MDD7776648.1 DUF262 domain-containing protein [Solobacterium sp.]MDY2952245.1 DUF262 domain-containing protein [Erysipelotrichaceae bacterium]